MNEPITRMSAALPVVATALAFGFFASATAQVSQTTQTQQTARPKPPVTTVPPKVNLGSVAKVIGEGWSVKTDWDLAFHYYDEDNPPKGADRATADIAKAIDEWRTARAALKATPQGVIFERDLIERYRADIMRLLKVSGPLLYTGLPIHFALKNNELTLILASKGSTNVYNTLRLDAKQRAIKELQETVLPAMKRFAVVNSTDIKNFGVLVAYGSKDYSDDGVLSTKPEVVALVASAERCRKLAAAELTEEEFVDAADVYVIDRDTISDLRKIKVSIDDNKGR